MKSRDEWLALRRNHLGASDCAAVLGQDPFRGPLDVYASKVLGHTVPDNKFMKYGRRLEPIVADLYADETGRPVYDPGATEFQVHPDLPWLAATLDRVTERAEHDTGPLELKTVHNPRYRPDEWSQSPPLHYQIQLQMQIACTGAQWGSLAGLFPGLNLQWCDQERHDKLISAALNKLEEFWVKHIVAKDPPPPTASPRALEIIKEMYPEESGEIIELGDEESATVQAWLVAKEHVSSAQKDLKRLEAELRGRMKDATFAKLSDGTFLTLKTTHRKGYTRIVEPGNFRVLRHTKKI